MPPVHIFVTLFTALHRGIPLIQQKSRIPNQVWTRAAHTKFQVPPLRRSRESRWSFATSVEGCAHARPQQNMPTTLECWPADRRGAGAAGRRVAAVERVSVSENSGGDLFAPRKENRRHKWTSERQTGRRVTHAITQMQRDSAIQRERKTDEPADGRKQQTGTRTARGEGTNGKEQTAQRSKSSTD
jgi:hypothetical protein